MSKAVGVFRGSFDPFHLGHWETINCALNHGLDQVIITYIDPNANKPNRGEDRTRSRVLEKVFARCNTVFISQKTFKATLANLNEDSTIGRICLIIGADLIESRWRPIKSNKTIDCLIVPRDQESSEVVCDLWNNFPVYIANTRDLVYKNLSSTKIRTYLAQNDLIKAKKELGASILETILSENLYTTPLRVEIDHLFQDLLQPISFQLSTLGLSEDLVFFIKDGNKKCHLVAKVFTNSEVFEAELLGYEKLRALQLKYIQIPKIHYARDRIIVMDFVEGESLAELMEKNPEAIELCAKANLELHQASTSLGVVPPTFCDGALDQIAIYSFEIAEQLRPHWNMLKMAFLQNPGLYSATHGDPNHFNWLVDIKEQKVTYIDLSQFSEQGFAMKEFYEAQLCFWTAARRIGGVSKEKVQEIREIYKEKYFENAPAEITTAESQAFFQAYWKLCIIKNLLSQKKSVAKEISQFLTN